jgi:NAD(P)-dependent dehydrogenase (short-subunit alcohol dehydrogenase family)
VARLLDKVFVVTGACSGIGRAVALKFATQEGARVLALDVNKEGGRELEETVEEQGGVLAFAACDIAEPEQVDAAIAGALERWGDLHGLVNAAALAPECPIAEMTTDFWDRIMRVNLRGTFVVCQSTIAALRKMGHGGALVLFASVGSMSGTPGLAAYSTSKGGVLSLTRVLAIELGAENIRVNSICPGPNDTPAFAERPYPMFTDDPDRFYANFPLLQYHRRLIDPSETADAVVFLASEESKFMTGSNLVVDGGFLAR